MFSCAAANQFDDTPGGSCAFLLSASDSDPPASDAGCDSATAGNATSKVWTAGSTLSVCSASGTSCTAALSAASSNADSSGSCNSRHIVIMAYVRTTDPITNAPAFLVPAFLVDKNVIFNYNKNTHTRSHKKGSAFAVKSTVFGTVVRHGIVRTMACRAILYYYLKKLNIQQYLQNLSPFLFYSPWLTIKNRFRHSFSADDGYCVLK